MGKRLYILPRTHQPVLTVSRGMVITLPLVIIVRMKVSLCHTVYKSVFSPLKVLSHPGESSFTLSPTLSRAQYRATRRSEDITSLIEAELNYFF